MTLLYKSGREVDPMRLRSRDLDIRDIAHNLSLICRFTGAFPFHYSVGQHSILVYEHMAMAEAPREAQLAGLLHDGAEFLFNDLQTQIKHHPLLAGYRKLEHDVSRLILATYGCSPDWLPLVKPYDEKVYQLEAATRRGISHSIQQLMPSTVYYRFLAIFHDLTK